MSAKFHVTVQQFDPHGNYTRETLPLNDAILELLRFARKHPDSFCTIELREVEQSVDARWAASLKLRVETLAALDERANPRVLELKPLGGSPQRAAPGSSFEHTPPYAASEHNTGA